MRRIKFLLIPVVLVCLLVGCAWLGLSTSTDPTTMTPKQLATFAMGLYNRQYESYKTDIANPNLTTVQKDFLVKRKAGLTKAWPIISTFDLLVASGQNPTKEQEQAIQAIVAEFLSWIPQK